LPFCCHSQAALSPTPAKLDAMPFKKHESGLLIYTREAEKKPFACRYDLDQRPDRDLVNLTQRLYRSIQPFLGDKSNIRLKPRRAVARDVIPDPVETWTTYLAVLIAGTADAALTAVLHNLGREARALVRQVFECGAKAAYFAGHPRIAKLELESEPFRELTLLDELGYDKRTRRYRDVKRECNALRRARPTLAKHAKGRELPSVKATVGRRKSRKTEKSYAFHYRIASQTVHGGILGMRDVFGENGVNFDGREDNPNLALLFMSSYILVFLRVLNDVFKLARDADLDAFTAEYQTLQKRILQPLAAAKRKKRGTP